MNSLDIRDNKSIQNRLVIAFCVMILVMLGLAFVPAVSATDTKLTYTDHNGRVGNAEQIDSSTMITVGRYNSENAKIWSYDAGAGTYNTKLTYTDHNDRIYDVEVLPSGYIISSDGSGNAKIWSYDAGAGTYNTKLTFTDHNGMIYDVKVLSSGNILTASTDNTVKIWSYDAGDGTYDIKINYTGHSGGIRDTTILPSGDVASASGDNTVKIWSYDAGAGTYNTKLTYIDHSNSLFTVEYLSDTGLIASGDSNDIIKIWSYDAGAGTYNTKLTYTDHSGYGINDIEEIASGDIVSVSSSAKVWNYDAGAGKYNTNTTYNGHGGSSIYDAQQLKSGYIITSSADNTAQIWDTNYGLQAPSQKIAKPVQITDVEKPNNQIEIYGINNSDLTNGDTIDISWGDGTTDTVTYNTTSTYRHTYSNAGDYTITMTGDESRSTNVTIHSDPVPSIDLVPNSPVLEGQAVEFRGNNTTAGTTANRATTDPLTVTDGLVQYNAYYKDNSKDSFYSGSYHDYQNRSGFSEANQPTDQGVGYYAVGNVTYQSIPIQLSQDWTISSYHNTNPAETSIIWGSPSGHGVAVKNGDLIRISPVNGNTTITSNVDYNGAGHNITVSHDGSGSFAYYVDGSYVGSDNLGESINDDAYIKIGADSLGGVQQSDFTEIDDWRIYNKDLTDNQISNLHDSYTVDIPSGTDYQWLINGSLLSTQEIYNETNGFNTGDYNVTLKATNADSLRAQSTTTLSVQDVVPPTITNVSPQGDLNQRDIDIQADISHPKIGSNYQIEVKLTRLNEQTGQTKTLKNVSISSNQTVIYDAKHTNTSVEDYDVNREYFEYQWSATEPQQSLTETSDTKRYSIPVSDVIFNNVEPKGLQPDRDNVNISADISGTVTSTLDVSLERYSLINDSTSTIYTTQISGSGTVSTIVDHPLNQTAVPQNYTIQNRYSYQWVAETDSGKTYYSNTTNYRVPGIIYPIDRNADLVGNSINISSVVDINDSFAEYTISRSGKYNATVFMSEFSRSYTALMYDKTDSKVFNKTFSADNDAFDYAGLKVSESYIILSTTINNRTYEVDAGAFINGNATVTVRDGTKYFVAVSDGETRRAVGPYTADINNKDTTQTVSPRSVRFSEDTEVDYQISTTYNKTTTNGTIEFKLDANNQSIENLNLQIIRDDDNKIIYDDTQSGTVDTYLANITATDQNSSYTVKWQYYDINKDETIKGSQVVTLTYQDALGELPDWMTTVLAIIILLMLVGILEVVSSAWSIFVLVAVSILMVTIGWLPVSYVVVLQATTIAVIYYISRDDTT